ncbi:MAG TPA: hypothetical protein VFX18_04290 [Candidatus Nitrosocosmicus sp.]|nr:hypothetical protein [Candidatus Nitrosocosmicus sp.]
MSDGWLAVYGDIIDYLKHSYPKYESILIGCRIGKYVSYDCCEYNIIVLRSNDNNKTVNKEKSLVSHFNKKKLVISFIDTEKFIKSCDSVFLNYVSLTNVFFKNNQENYFEKKIRYNQINLKLFVKRKLFALALENIQINKEISIGTIDQYLSSFYTKMLSFEMLELMIQLYLNEMPSPSHLKYQINAIRESNIKNKEDADILLDILDIDQSNISSVERSMRSLIFLLKVGKISSLNLELLSTKLDYFKKKSMYVDANLLIHSFIKNQYFEKSYIKNYVKILKYILNIKNKDKIFISKELESIFDIIKNWIENSY